MLILELLTRGLESAEMESPAALPARQPAMTMITVAHTNGMEGLKQDGTTVELPAPYLVRLGPSTMHQGAVRLVLLARSAMQEATLDQTLASFVLRGHTVLEGALVSRINISAQMMQGETTSAHQGKWSRALTPALPCA